MVGVLAAVYFRGGESDESPAPVLQAITPEIEEQTEFTDQPLPPGTRGVGIYPTEIDFGETLGGGQYDRALGVLNGGAGTERFAFSFEGDIAPWLSVLDPASQTPLDGGFLVDPITEGRVRLRAAVPADIPPGQYEGAVLVATVQEEATTDGPAGASAGLGALVPVEITVGGSQVIAGSLVDVRVPSVEAGAPLSVRTTLENTSNVQVDPEVKLVVRNSSGEAVGEQTYEYKGLHAQETTELVSEWDTTGQNLGPRTATVSVSYAGTEIGSRAVDFEILEAGALTRNGELEGIRLANSPRPGELAKIAATFRNTGQIETRARFVGELYQDGRLVGEVESEERLLIVGEALDLEALAGISEDGDYRVVGKVNYEGRETGQLEAEFTVGSPRGGMTPWVWRGLLLAGVIALGVAGFLAARWFNQRHSTAAP
jgi:hypothetical protein